MHEKWFVSQIFPTIVFKYEKKNRKTQICYDANILW